MPSFEEQFRASETRSIEWQGKTLIRADRFPVSKGDVLLCSIEKFNNSLALQGFCIDVTGHCELDGEVYKKGKGVRMMFWCDGSAPPLSRLKIFPKGKDYVVVYNVCECPAESNVAPSLEYWHSGAAMVVEEIPNGRRYRCSDIHSCDKEDQFGDIVFTVQMEV